MTCELKEGLDLNQLTSGGADFEVIPREDTYIEDEEEVEEKLLYQRNVVEHLNPECVDIDDGENGSDSEVCSTSVNIKTRHTLV